MAIGRPRTEINFTEFEKLCGIHCTLEEISAYFCCSEDTIETRVKEHYGQPFSDIIRQKKGLGKLSLRRKMFQQALAGDKTLLIWLSKNHLGMTDKIEQKTEMSVKPEQEQVKELLDRLTNAVSLPK